MESKKTPVLKFSYEDNEIEDSETGKRVAWVDSELGELLAAAPDLLSALDRLLNTYQGLSIKEWKDAVDAGHAAIAKARGERSR